MKSIIASLKFSNRQYPRFDIQRTDELFSGWNDDNDYGTSVGLDKLIYSISNLSALLCFCSCKYEIIWKRLHSCTFPYSRNSVVLIMKFVQYFIIILEQIIHKWLRTQLHLFQKVGIIKIFQKDGEKLESFIWLGHV